MKRAMALLAVFLASAASADLGSVTSSFRLSGTSMPYVTGIIYRPRFEVFYWCALYSNGPDYLLKYNSQGSIIGSYELTGCVAPGDMDSVIGYHSHYNKAVLDERRAVLLEYVLTTGSLVGSTPVPPNTKGYGSLYEWRFLGIGTWVYRYNENWSIVSSFNNGTEIGGIAGTGYFLKRTWPIVIVAPRGPGLVNCFYVPTGSRVASFAVPGYGTRGAHCASAAWGIQFFCNRVTPGGMYLYAIDIEGVCAVEPASLGRVKALFK